MENIILVKNEYEIQIRHAKNTPMAGDLRWKHRWWSPTPNHSVLLSFRGLVLCLRYFTSFLRAQKGLFARVNCPFLLTWYFSTRDAKYPFYLRKIHVNACFTPPPPFTPKHKPTSRVQCMPCVQATRRQLVGSFFALCQSFSHTCPSGIPPPNHQSMHNKVVRM